MGTPLKFSLKGASWSIVFHYEVLEYLNGYIQHKAEHESAGQLFCNNPLLSEISISRISRSAPLLASKFGISINRKLEIFKRWSQFRQGYHCIGMWHTHPEYLPSPSNIDLEFGRNHALAAQTHLNGFILCIRGLASYPDGLYVGIHDGNTIQRMELD